MMTHHHCVSVKMGSKLLPPTTNATFYREGREALDYQFVREKPMDLPTRFWSHTQARSTQWWLRSIVPDLIDAVDWPS